MKRLVKTLTALVLCVCICLVPAAAAEPAGALEAAAEYITATVTSPTVSSIGGEWSVLALARSSLDVPDKFYNTYLSNLRSALENGGGVLHERKYSEYSRVILALTAMDEEPEDFAGYDLLSYLTDMDKISLQGLNGCIYALLAMDAGNYPVRAGATATRAALVDKIVASQKADGGFGLGSDSDVDITAAALQALSKYKGIDEVKTAIDSALAYLSKAQLSGGGFSGWGGESSESTAQVIMALCELGISIDDSRFVKNASALDSLLAMQCSDGGFKHYAGDTKSNLMATEQALCALVSLHNVQNGARALYDMAPDEELSIKAETPLCSREVWSLLDDFVSRLGG